jgi:hypothetical protein
MQTKLAQSAGTLQAFISGHAGHVPPQLTSVSVPFFAPSTQLGALHICCVQASDSQSAPVRQLWPIGQGAEHPAPHAGAPSGAGAGHAASTVVLASFAAASFAASEASRTEVSLSGVSSASVDASTATTVLPSLCPNSGLAGVSPAAAPCGEFWPHAAMMTAMHPRIVREKEFEKLCLDMRPAH